jgi:multiple sugar transport system permease protein
MAGENSLKKYLWVIFFISPSLIGLMIFMVLPMLASLGLTFMEWDPLLPTRFQFSGFANYRLLVQDKTFFSALFHTLYFIVGYIPLVLACGLGVAILLNHKLKGLAIFRAAFFIPVVSAWVAVALLWTWIFNPQYGLLNYFIGMLGIQGPAWLFDPNWAMPAIIITSVWKDIGFISILYLTGLQNIPDEYYEAASMDGAAAVQKFFKITLPLLGPTTFFALIISLINSFQVFDQVYIMTGGGPAGATTVLVERIVNHAFRYGRMGYAATISWALFLLVFSVTLFQTRLQKRWVSYE